MKTCTKCLLAKDLSEFGNDRKTKDGKRYRCKPCNNKASSAWTSANPERHAANVARTRRKDPERAARWFRESHWRRQGIAIDMDAYNLLLAQQQGVCAVCARKPHGKYTLVVDHCHKTGRVRGLLHNNCNRALGYLQDDPDVVARAADYLRRQVL